MLVTDLQREQKQTDMLSRVYVCERQIDALSSSVSSSEDTIKKLRQKLENAEAIISMKSETERPVHLLVIVVFSVKTTQHLISGFRFNPLKCSGVRQLHLKVSVQSRS